MDNIEEKFIVLVNTLEEGIYFLNKSKKFSPFDTDLFFFASKEEAEKVVESLVQETPPPDLTVLEFQIRSSFQGCISIIPFLP